jgi:hypothetical protein
MRYASLQKDRQRTNDIFGFAPSQKPSHRKNSKTQKTSIK